MQDLNQGGLVNRVANSGLLTLNLENYFPKAEFAEMDLKPYLHMELILKEKDFRGAMKSHDWSQYENKTLLVFCSTDAIIPVWAYMLVSSLAAPFAEEIYMGTKEDFIRQYYKTVLNSLNLESYRDKRVVIKGCSDLPVPPDAYLEITKLLQPLAQSIMYGEPCSTVPIFKRPRVINKK